MASATAAGLGVLHARRAHDPVLHLLLDVRLPADRRLDLGDGRPARARLPDRRHRRPHHADRRGPAARRRPLAAARGDQPGGRALRPGVRLRGQPHHAGRPASGCTARPTSTRTARTSSSTSPSTTSRSRSPSEPEDVDVEGILKGIHQVSHRPSGDGPAGRSCSPPASASRGSSEAAAAAAPRTGASRPTPGRSPRGTSWPATPSRPRSGTCCHPDEEPAHAVRHRQAGRRRRPGRRGVATTCARCRCRSPAGCPATTASSAPTASASPTPAPPPGGSSTSTPSRSSSQALQALADAGEVEPRPGRGGVREVPHRRPDRGRRRASRRAATPDRAASRDGHGASFRPSAGSGGRCSRRRQALVIERDGRDRLTVAGRS